MPDREKIKVSDLLALVWFGIAIWDAFHQMWAPMLGNFALFFAMCVISSQARDLDRYKAAYNNLLQRWGNEPRTWL